MLIKNKTIAIVGGGPGGLTLARLLQLKGAKVKVYERDFNKYARVQGSPLDLHEESGLAALRQADLLDEFKNNYRSGADKKIIANEKGEILFSDHADKPLENFGSAYFRPEIDRGPLRNLLLESLLPETVVWNCHFISMEAQSEGWLMHFKNGTTAYADLVIAADGANSKIRPYLTDMAAFYTGITMVEINIHAASKATPQFHSMLDGGKMMAFGNSQGILMGSKANDDLGFYLSVKTPLKSFDNKAFDYADKVELLTWFKKEYSGWSDMWCDLIGNAEMPIIPRPIYCMPLDQSWQTLPNLTMLGDAAHVMPPFAGEGVNMAMLDALELSENLTSIKFKNLHEAISEYEKAMRERASMAAKESLQNGELMHSENALNGMLHMFSEH